MNDNLNAANKNAPPPGPAQGADAPAHVVSPPPPQRILEALLFAGGQPLTAERGAAAGCHLPDAAVPGTVRPAIARRSAADRRSATLMTLPLVEELVPAPDPWDVARRLAHLPHLLFLDSAEFNADIGRYSYVTADPVDILIRPA